MLDIETIKPEIGDLCRKLKVKRLDIFGSATSDDFRPDSDVDMLVQFERDKRVWRMFWEEQLAWLLKRQ